MTSLDPTFSQTRHLAAPIRTSKGMCCVLGLTAVIAIAPFSASASILDPYIARAQVVFQPLDRVSKSEDTLSAVANVDPQTGDRGQSGAASASASNQGLKASAFSQVMSGAAGQPARVFNANASAKAQSFDVVLSDDTGSGKTHTSVSMSFFLDGFLSMSGIDSKGNSWVRPGLTLTYGLGQAGIGFPPVFNEIGKLSFLEAFQSATDNPVAQAKGIFEGLEYRSSDLISQEFTTETSIVPLDTVLTFRLEMSVSAGGTSNHGDQLGATAAFGNTLTFSPDALFNLAPGITANSASLGLTNNRFAGSSTSNPSPVPLPASFWLLPVAIGALRALKSKPRKSPCI